MSLPAWLLRAAPLVPLGLLPLAALVLARTGRSHEPAVWYPWALLVLVLPVMVLLSGRRTAVGRFPAVGLALAAGYAGWQYLSILWADFRGAALLEANRSAVYAAAVAVVVLLVDSPARRRVAVVAVSSASALLALSYVVLLLKGDATAELFLYNRLAMPIGYPSATAAFLLIGVWPLMTLSVDPQAAPWLRLFAGGGAALLPATAVLTQSRGGLLFLGLSAAVFFVASPLRARAVVPLLIGLGGAAVLFDTLSEPLRSPSPVELEAAARDAAEAILLLGGVGTAVALVWSVVDRRGLVPDGLATQVARVAVGAVAVLALVGAGAALRADAPTRVADYWETFRSGGDQEVEGTRLFSSAGSNRYDFWRGALLELRERPLTGYGAGNFGWRYLQIRDNTEMPANAHGEVFEAAGTLGFPGLLLYGSLGAVTLLAAPLIGRGGDRALGAGVFAAAVQWLAQAQIDWLWQNPAVGLLGATLTGCALTPGAPGRRPLPRVPGVPVLAGTVLVAVATLGLVPVLLAERWVDGSHRVPPGEAVRLAARAGAWQPLSATGPLAEARAHRRGGDQDAMVAALREAVEREPRNWPAWQQLETAERARGRPAAADEACRAARATAPFVRCG